MFKEIQPINLATNKPDHTFEYPTPGKCPLCKTGTNATPLASFSVCHGADSHLVYIMFFCHNCEACFLGVYYCYEAKSGYRNLLELKSLSPTEDDVSDFSNRIQLLSPDFVRIYNQSEKAEYHGLSEICGMGFRKSLEFLVKDFSITLFPEMENTIKSKPLKQCINDYIRNDHIRTLAEASAWIGNDETHYARKHNEYNVSDLKIFIQAMITYVDYELAYIDAKKLISH